jgi:hypothetical protein
MPIFDTPTPIAVTIEAVVGVVRITASERTDTVVEVRPGDGSSEAAKAAEAVIVELSNGHLSIKTPKRLRSLGWLKGAGSINVTVELPAGSSLRGEMAMGALHGTGRLGNCRFKIASGNITLDHVDGSAEVATSSGDLRIAEVSGTAEIDNSNGNIWVGRVAGNLRMKSAKGHLSVDRAGADVSAKTAKGHVRIGEVSSGSVVIDTAKGELEVGIAEGTAAWLDVRSWAGKVRNHLDVADRPEPTDRTVEVRARTYAGDIVIRRAKSSPLHPNGTR